VPTVIRRNTRRRCGTVNHDSPAVHGTPAAHLHSALVARLSGVVEESNPEKRPRPDSGSAHRLQCGGTVATFVGRCFSNRVPAAKALALEAARLLSLTAVAKAGWMSARRAALREVLRASTLPAKSVAGAVARRRSCTSLGGHRAVLQSRAVAERVRQSLRGRRRLEAQDVLSSDRHLAHEAPDVLRLRLGEQSCERRSGGRAAAPFVSWPKRCHRRARLLRTFG
jgi:hypothetical protein